jgi:hypothetical protein
MGHEIIADGNGAFIYDNTTGRAITPRITHPEGRTKGSHERFAKKLMEIAETPPDKRYPGFKQYQDAIDTAIKQFTEQNKQTA